ncbi:hypothetical protein GQ53DRAFT_751404 [Thozetella sp. PMI_491]|nr:hypothetical protein GQ53DRAFT_751404 [Thozetella sp. PMI_491]
MSRALLRSILELRAPATRLPPSFLLPIRARHFNQTSQIIEPTQPAPTTIPAQAQAKQAAGTPKPSPISEAASSFSQTAATATPQAESSTSQGAGPLSPASLDPSVRTLLPLLAAQPARYITVHIHAKPYLVTAGDQVRLPFKMAGVVPGDVLRLNRASVLGSRDLTLRGAPYIDERLFECRAVVLGTESEPMRVLIKKKQRNRRKKHVRSKHKYTMLRISEVKVNQLEEMEV